MRKAPRQRRARQTVDFILDAAAYILAERGLDGFTTNHIAERAGVNISSLYQYFPNKLAILEALQVRHIATPDVNYAQGLERLQDQPLEEVVRSLVDVALDMHAANPTMQKLFLDTLPRQTRRLHDDFEADRIAKLAEVLLPKSRASQNPDMMLFIARHALTWVVHEAVCDRPEWLTDPAFREELVALLVSFLRAD
jgi:AcrR family transcriptional regulator